jgi:uroporphyrinogen-III decarboxylase
MITRQQTVRQAMRFQQPGRVPIVFWNRDQAEGDVLLYHLSLGVPGDGTPEQNLWDWQTNEWGYRLERLGDGTMGHPTQPYYAEAPEAGEIRVPALRETERMSAVSRFQDRCEDRYRLASLDLSGFTVYTLLRGFENAMQDFVLREPAFADLMDAILHFECDLIAMAARYGFDGIHFADDWGTQSGMMVSPPLWRSLFKPRYRQQFAWAHEQRLDVWYHCCGNFAPIVEDFHEIGVDVLNISQPNVMDLEYVSARLRGKQCFMMPLSYQTTSIQGTPPEILEEAGRMYRLLATRDGGFIGYVEEYGCMGMSADNYRACAIAFRQLQPDLLRD